MKKSDELMEIRHNVYEIEMRIDSYLVTADKKEKKILKEMMDGVIETCDVYVQEYKELGNKMRGLREKV